MTQMWNRRQVLAGAASVAVMKAVSRAQSGPAILDVASAGAFRQMVEGPLKQAAAKTLNLELRSHAMGADAVARAIVDGSLQADVFVPITASPMRIVFAGGRADVAVPIARTEMVITYSPKSKFAERFAAAAQGQEDWWKVLETPGIRIARSDPGSDPSGRCVIFVLMLAAKKYRQPDLVDRVLGPVMNPQQVGVKDAQALFASGEIDAMASYKTGPLQSGMPYITLPKDVNLSEDDVAARNADVKLEVGGKTFLPEPTVFYVAALRGAKNPVGAAAFVKWLQGSEAQALLQQHGFEAPSGAKAIGA